MKQVFEYLLIGCGLSLLISAVRLATIIVALPVPDWLDRTMAGIACAPLVGMAGLMGAALLMRGVA